MVSLGKRQETQQKKIQLHLLMYITSVFTYYADLYIYTPFFIFYSTTFIWQM